MIESLGDWQRTHYSKEITPEMDEDVVIVMGWTRALRKIGKITFIQLADREGYIQIKAEEGEVKPEILKKIDLLGREYVIAVRGSIEKNKEAPNGVEIIPMNIKILNTSEAPLPLEIVTKKTPAELPTRLNARFLDLRKPETAAIFDVSDTLKISFMNHFDKLRFVNINPPLIITAASEGGAELFKLKYFDKEAFLAQSPQLYKQIIMASGLDKVSIVTPVFRAEPHETTRHINEAIQMDIEVAFIKDEEDVLKYYDSFMEFAIREVKKRCSESLKILKINLETIKTPIKRVTYDEALDILKKNFKINIKWGQDLTPEAERKLCEVHNPVLITKWPTDVRSFYCMAEPGEERKCRAFDLLYNGIEISSGAQRIHVLGDLVKALKRKKLPVKSFEPYLNAFKYGMPSHGGWSIGLERFTMSILKLSNIKEATLFPRTKERLTP